MRHILCLDDFEDAARRRLPRPIFAYYSGGVETNASLRDNRDAFERVRLRAARARRASRSASQETTLFGERYAAPFGIAPMGLERAVDLPRRHRARARGASRPNIPMILSGTSLIRLEEVAQAAPRAWFQAYLPGRRPSASWRSSTASPPRASRRWCSPSTSPCSPTARTTSAPASRRRCRPSLRLAWDGVIRPRWTVGTFLRTLVKHGMPHFENSYAERGAPIISGIVLRDFSARDHLELGALRADPQALERASSS